ncbi:hypothetical protein JOE61_000923 [Nocardioides salarius]|uniref:Pentapeptide repeat-containing protein n=1 Tax=Nocardioides salarius TaxID=374513 RepID=A0ABS2M7E2_9ACTN|nr:hypothetical protein [Nocardioides salarius]MBM7507109.1 hypothetical protein [Nocardioides salarius]
MTTTPPQWVPYLTLIAAVLAAGVALFAAILQRKSGREAAAAARESAAAAKKSSEASERSAKASEDSVALNAETSRATAARLESEGLAKRFQDAASQLGHDQPAVRLAGVYSLARLADDWPDQRQTCVDVLCALLRMQQKMKTYVEEQQYPIDLPDDGDQQVRRTVMELISSRVNGTDALWAGCDFNLAYARLADFKLRNATISGKVILNGAIIEGGCSFTRTTFDGGLDAQELRIEGTLKLTDVLPGPGRTVSLSGSYIDRGGTLDFVLAKPPTADKQWNVWPTKIICRGTFAVKVTKTTYEQATFHIRGLHLEPTARFRVVQVPPAEAGSAEYPTIEAKEWATTASARIEVAGALQHKGVFKPSEWTGVEHHQFKDAYTTGPNIDAILGDDDA